MMTQIAFYQAKLAYETDSWDVFESLQRGEPLLLIDGRSPEAFARESIPGALNLPHRRISAETTAQLPRDHLLVAFCDGIGCNGSTRTALKLAELGFRVKELQGGIDWWKRDGYATTATPGRQVQCGCEG
ncbi:MULTISPECIES: rhodanese-like domain-containing protein [unclassified Paludibacterium]|uniref:rhodanese-like domain-containing protein n=1 Tax=unclassified Paludibacterium TaxID=2618429 RepID=UPI001C053DF1|nr:rhodanese-like domain-containing protein [Paludibacterium sp. B53371]BEV73079.1 rhodanese-like domain-containing protein [Paludibacterium sp. THUN1379]